MTYDVPHTEGEIFETEADTGREGWPLWEVFVRARRGLSHNHCGSLHAPDAATALTSARDVYTRRAEGVSVWVVPSETIIASDPDDAKAFFDTTDKPYRHATHYDLPDEVDQM